MPALLFDQQQCGGASGLGDIADLLSEYSPIPAALVLPIFVRIRRPAARQGHHPRLVLYSAPQCYRHCGPVPYGVGMALS
jgi:hypothetical protein